MALAIAIVCVVVSVLAMAGSFNATMAKKINIDALMAQIHKPVMANNVDRAVKLTNAAPGTWMAKATKMLLVKANRVHELELTFQEAWLFLDGDVKTRGWGAFVMMLAHAALYGALGFALMVGEDFSLTIAILMGVSILLSWFAQALIHSQYSHKRKCRQALVRLRNLLFGRSEYVPPQFQPRDPADVGSEELARWREAMDAFNKGVRNRTSETAKMKVTEMYDEAADDRGVLPPLG